MTYAPRWPDPLVVLCIWLLNLSPLTWCWLRNCFLAMLDENPVSLNIRSHINTHTGKQAFLSVLVFILIVKQASLFPI